ncbi:MAG: PAC2 family protein [Dehalococcoidales bacterium]|nr:PAC2 family protein [Dehalococcoidales bacterium]
MTELLKFSDMPKLNNPTMIVSWEADAAHLGEKVTEYLLKSLNAKPFCEIDPVEFFPLGGVVVENDVVQFPQSTFYACAEHDLIIFHSTAPVYEWAKFFNIILDIAQQYYHGKEMYSLGTTITLNTHTAPRNCWAISNSNQIKNNLAPYILSQEMDFETPPGNHPTLNSYLLWIAQKRNFAAANIWVPVPFYLTTADDPKAYQNVLGFLDSRLNLNLDFQEFYDNVAKQDKKLMRLRKSSPEINSYFNKLEIDKKLSQEEHEKLYRTIDDFLGKHNNKPS